MTRVKGGSVSKTRRRKVLKEAKGYFGSKHRLYKTAQEQVFHSGNYAFRDRKQNKRNFRKLWITRINAACRMNDISYSKFINGLAKANVEVNRKMLAELAINDEVAFTNLVNIAKEALAVGWPAMHQKLKTIDPVSYQKLNPNDKQRVSRALEVYQMTGRAMSSFFENKQCQCPFERLEYILLPENDDRTHLRELIRIRFNQMLKDGLIDEVQKLKDRGDLNLDLPSMRCVGYRQVWEYLEGKLDKEQMIEASVIATAHLAKHQMTWLRGSLANAQSALFKKELKIGDPNNLEVVLESLQEFL